MKQTKQIIAAAVMAILAFTLTIYSSCNNACKNVTCQNGGGCNGGSCACVSGYTGNLCELSSIVFQNNTFTPITITVNNIPKVIPAGASLTYSDTAGKSAVVTAYTFATSSANTAVGDTITWSFTDTYPTGGSAALSQPMNAGTAYFYLKMINNDPSQTVDSIVVSYGTSAASATTYVSVPPHTGLTYDLGYYLAFPSTTVNSYGSASGIWTCGTDCLSLLYTGNQSATVTIP